MRCQHYLEFGAVGVGVAAIPEGLRLAVDDVVLRITHFHMGMRRQYSHQLRAPVTQRVVQDHRPTGQKGTKHDTYTITSLMRR